MQGDDSLGGCTRLVGEPRVPVPSRLSALLLQNEGWFMEDLMPRSRRLFQLTRQKPVLSGEKGLDFCQCLPLKPCRKPEECHLHRFLK